MFQTIRLHKYSYVSLATLSMLTAWWIFVQQFSQDNIQREYFSASYGIMALCGSLMGLSIARKWGYAKSYMGKAILLLSYGLFLQFMGQLSYSAYTFLLHIEIPYPSLGDLGYFGSIPLYIAAAIFIARAAGANVGISSYKGKIIATSIIALLGALTYSVFLSELDITNESLLTNILNVSYPVGQSMYVAVAIITYFLSRHILGGIMKSRVLLILIAFITQYIADFVFLYLTYKETWVTAGPNEYMYLLAYFIMTIALISLDNIDNSLRKKV